MGPDDASADDDPRLRQAARDYLADLEAGRVPDRRAYHARHPDLAVALAEAFDGIDLAHAAAQLLRAPPSPSTEAPGSPLGDFRIERELGRGGMGVVYEAVQLSLGRRVALKVLPFAAALDARQLQRFKTEAHAAAGLHHTNIVPVYAVGCERGVHYYAMQLIEGRPLDAVVRDLRGGGGDDPLGPTSEFRAGPTAATTGSRAGRGREAHRTAARLAAQVADALDYAHERGVVHRDVKPANLLLDAKGNVWVTDFGLAQVSADVSLTKTGDVVGTLRYMSPEQASGRRVDVDHRTDVYSLGATLYELLTLEPVFTGNDRQSLLHQILDEEPPPPRRRDRSVPPELETIVLKALAKAPADRYATAGAMAADLRRFLDERPILARRPTLIERARKLMRRHPAVVAAAVVVLAVVAVGSAVSTALTRAAYDRERLRAEEAEQRFQMARRSTDRLIQVAEEELVDMPQLEGLRRRLLEAALEYYQEFIALRGDDPELAATRDRVRRIIDDLVVLQGAWQHSLLEEPAVVAALKPTEEQRTRLAELTDRLAEQRQESFREFRRLSSEERQRRVVELIRGAQAALKEVLDPDQRNRLGQIALQVRGPAAFRDSDVIADLKLTADQRDAIRAVEAEMTLGRPPDGPRMGGPGPPRGEPREPRRGHEHAPPMMDKILAVLTPEQRARWRTLTGEPFTGPMPRPFGGRRGPPFAR